MSNIQLFKFIAEEINKTAKSLPEFNENDPEEVKKEYIVEERVAYTRLLMHHPEFEELRVMLHPDDCRKYQTFTPHDMYMIAEVDINETIEMLDAYEKFMTELSQTMDDIIYNPGDLHGTAGIVGDLRLVIRAGFTVVRKWYDNSDYNTYLEPRIGLQFTTAETAEFHQELNTLMNKTGEMSDLYLKHGIRDYVTCEIPEHRWYHQPGEKYLVTSIEFKDPFDGWRDGKEKEGCTSAEIHLIRDEIVRMRTIVKIMGITEYKI